MRLFIAEKPELARAIAVVLNGTSQKCDGYIQKDNDIVTWAFGHLLELAMPEDYDIKWKNWDLNTLPLHIEKFKYKPIERSKKQLKIVTDLIKYSKVTSIVHCGDADDEGQILIDEILNYAGNTKPVERLLINDLSPSAIKAELSKMKSNDEYFGLSQRGFARQRADWLVGINLTRAYTQKARSYGYGGVLTLGRVQTPILSLIVSRDKEHESFNSSEYFTIGAVFDVNGIQVKTNLKTDEKIISADIAGSIVKDCENSNATLTQVKTEQKTQKPPLPYNLLVLQSDCSKLFGFKPDKTLEITQTLREKYHLITYNRSDCQYLPDTIYEDSNGIISNLQKMFDGSGELEFMVNGADSSIKSSAFNSANVSAHHAIVPTKTKADLKELSKDELAVFTLIVKRYIAQFYENKEFQTTNLEFSLKEHTFVATSSKVTKAGFSQFFSKDENSENDEENENSNIDLSSLEQGANCTCSKAFMVSRKTKPKPYYTMSSLLNDLTGVAKYAVDPKIKALLLQKDSNKKGENGGIGTPATRAEHIKKLIEKEYIVVSNDKKQIVNATQKGKDLISLAPKLLTTADMTALWFEEQKMIESKEITLEHFLAGVLDEVGKNITELKESNMENFTKEGVPCPACNKGILIRRQNKKGTWWWGCSNYQNGCKAIFYDNNGRPKFPSTSENSEPCPVCKTGYLIERVSAKGNTWYSCSNWNRDGSGCNAKFMPNKQTGKLEEMVFKN